MKVSVVGTGRVGSAIAFAVVLRRLADELVLVGKPAERAAGDAADLQHAAAMGRPMLVRAGGLDAAAGSDVVVIAASSGVPPAAAPDGRGGAAPMPDRMAELRGNAAVFRELLPPLVSLAPRAVYLVVSNPVDVLTGLTLQLGAGVLSPRQVIGTGTLIDTARYRTLLAARMGMHTNDIRAYVLGEHGERQFPAVSCATAGGRPLAATPEGEAMCRQLGEQARSEGHRVFLAKGYTNYAIAAAVVMLLEAIAEDHRSVFPVSTLLENYGGIDGVRGVCLSVPAVIGRGGVVQVIELELSADERASLAAGAAVVRSALESV
ncbi:MAG: malate dehydrogenase [Tepidisphaerales bacterium]